MSSHPKHAALGHAPIFVANPDNIVSCPHVSEEAHRPADTWQQLTCELTHHLRTDRASLIFRSKTRRRLIQALERARDPSIDSEAIRTLPMHPAVTPRRPTSYREHDTGHKLPRQAGLCRSLKEPPKSNCRRSTRPMTASRVSRLTMPVDACHHAAWSCSWSRHTPSLSLRWLGWAWRPRSLGGERSDCVLYMPWRAFWIRRVVQTSLRRCMPLCRSHSTVRRLVRSRHVLH